MNSFTNNNLEKIYITGEKKLTGSVNISGAKNAALPLMALSLIRLKSLLIIRESAISGKAAFLAPLILTLPVNFCSPVI